MMRVVLFLGGELTYDIFVRGSVYIFLRDEWGFYLLFFSFSLVTLSSCTLVLWPFIYDIHCIYFHIYDDVVFHLSFNVLFLFSLYTHVSLCMQSLFLFHTKMPWWVLYKCFRKIGCENLPCHELSSYKVFQEFVLGLDFLVIQQWLWV